MQRPFDVVDVLEFMVGHAVDVVEHRPWLLAETRERHDGGPRHLVVAGRLEARHEAGAVLPEPLDRRREAQR